MYMCNVHMYTCTHVHMYTCTNIGVPYWSSMLHADAACCFVSLYIFVYTIYEYDW